MNLSSSMIALSILSGGAAGGASDPSGAGNGGSDAPLIEGPKARKAHKQYTALKVPAPWEQKGFTPADASALAAVRVLSSFTQPAPGDRTQTDSDFAAVFTAFRAVDRLQVLAQAAAKTDISAADRAQLERAFQRGMTQLRQYIGSTATDKLSLTFGANSSRAESSVLSMPRGSATFTGNVVVASPDTVVEGLTGTEKFEVAIGIPGGTRDKVTVDLSTGPSHPTLKNVVDAINAAIASIPDRDASGDIITDESGAPRPRWETRFAVRELGEHKYAIGYDLGYGELASIKEVGAGDALMVAEARHGKSEADALELRRYTASGSDLTAVADAGKDVSIDRVATARAAAKIDAEAEKKGKDYVKPDPTVNAGLHVNASTSDADGNSYVVGTASGDYGAVRGNGTKSLFLTKLDSGGRILWRRAIGAASDVEGAAVAVDANGNVSVAGSVAATSSAGLVSGHDADMVVARFSSSGDQLLNTKVDNWGNDAAKAITADSAGNIIIGGSGSEGGLLVKLDASGDVLQRVKVDAATEVHSLATDRNGDIVALTREDGHSVVRRYSAALDAGAHFDLGADVLANAVAVASDGRLAVVGGADAQIPGDQVNTRAENRDAFVTILSTDLSSARTTYIASADDDTADSLTIADGSIYVGGRTYGALDGARRGRRDGFVARVALSDGQIGAISQFGREDDDVGSVQVDLARGGGGHLSVLGLAAGELGQRESAKIVGQTGIVARPSGDIVSALRNSVGDTFRIQVGKGKIETVPIDANDTLATLRDKLKKIVGKSAIVSVSSAGGDAATLRISVMAGEKITLIEGKKNRDGGDALAKLGFTAGVYASPANSVEQRLKPGGTFGLKLDDTLSIDTKDSATRAAEQLASASSALKNAYASLFWTEAKAKMADNDGKRTGTGGSSAYDLAKLASYKSALARLTAGSGTSSMASLL
ncbi:hypothetical protein FHY02_000221 [Sphingomonas sp. BK069]|nr:hypothetical protein [Sphingomonas sp. BK069]